MSVEEQISELIDKYEGLNDRRLKQFNEENTKKDFILPLFRHLGWDVTNSDEVAAEEKSSNGRVDYAFKIGGVSKFYLEAKPLREDLNQRPDWAKQVITYAENKGVTWAVLTNFKQLMVFNAEWDKPVLERARFLNLTYQEYLPAFHKLWWLSRDSLEKGILDEEARQVGALKPKLPVEKSLLDQLLRWRGELFNQIYQHNRDRGLDFLQVDALIQQFINRLIFIRSTEDRGIEENRLRATLHQWRDSKPKGELVERLRAIFHDFATLYDSDLFPLLDTWDSVFVESDTIEEIIEGSYERSTRLAGYDFAAIPPKVLGAVYEQYLGYVAQEAKEEAKKGATQARLRGLEAPVFELEARRIKRKQQGIYYTPEFVVDYIVKETVGRFIKEHSHNDILNIKILDPACGSGSFLIRAYDELLHYHARQQGKSPAELDPSERRRILLGNIFGVDLDRQAVEITRLSLLLSCVAKREILPSLADNIRQGNSLISGTEEELKGYFGDNWEEKKRFNWKEEFKDIMANGGFDVVIGNPPYGAEFDEHDRSYIEDRYPYSKDNKNSAMVFIEKGLSLTKEGGFFSFIIPKSLAFSQKWASGRKLILDRLGAACDASKAFKEVLLEQMVVVISQKFTDKPSYEAAYLEQTGATEQVSISKETAVATDTILLGISEKELRIFNKLTSSKLFMRDISNTARGLPFQKHVTKDPSDVPVYRGDHIARYTLYKTTETLPEAVLARADKKISFLHQPKIMSQQIIAHVQNPTDHIILMSTLDKDGVLTLDTVRNTLLTDKRFAYGFITGLLNSKLWSWYAYRFIYSKAVRTMHFDEYYLGKLPLPRIDFANPKDKKMHDDLVALVKRMLELNKRLAPIRNVPFSESDELLREIKRTDAEIDQKVYELYGLSEEGRQVIGASLVSKS